MTKKESEKEYKQTLNLPQTNFSMRANLAQREPKQLKTWQDKDIYAQLRAIGKDRPKFFFTDGPPYANGDIHIGHAVNKILKDIIIKSRTLDGFDAPYIPGWDCHGLPIEHQVEKKYGKPGQKLDANAFRKACREYALKQVDGQRKDFIRLGVLGDWDNPYLTMNPKFEAEQIRGFAKIIENGHVYKGYKPVHWCLDCQSALAEAEVEYQDKKSSSIDVRFPVVDSEKFLNAFGLSSVASDKISVPIWTTTPWTIPANQAVTLHPELNYSLVEITSTTDIEILLFATDMLESVLERFGFENSKVLANADGEKLSGILLQHPLFASRQVPIVLGEHVTTEAGTGAVHTAPGHGVDDFNMGIKYKLPLENPVGGNGVYLPDTEIFGGQHIYKANDVIIEALDNAGALIKHQKIEHSYPHCWRHKSPVIFRATPQWFVGMDSNGLRKRALEEIPTVKWIPGWGEQRIEGMVDGRPDWCISRQRVWGVPIPLYVHNETGDMHPDTQELLEKVAQAVEVGGIEAWFAMADEELLGDDAKNYERTTDIMDVWFDSGSVHHCVPKTHDLESHTADLYLEGSDQHRGWFQSSLLTSMAMYDKPPYKAVLTHGFVVDENGRKMSKSLGNVTAPQKVANTLGADIIRLWTAAADYSREMTVSDEIFKRVADSYRRIRNTVRFLLSNLHGFDYASDALETNGLLSLDKWMIARTAEMQIEITQAYKSYEFHHIYQKLHTFCSEDLGGFYLDIIKDRLYTMPEKSLGRRSAQTAMYHVLHSMVRWLAPIISFTADEIWESMADLGKDTDSVVLKTWYDLPSVENMTQDWNSVIEIRDIVAKALEEKRSAGEIGSALEANIVIHASGANYQALASLGDELRFVFITSGAELKESDSDEVSVEIVKSEAEKCVRCWHRRDDYASHTEHPELCGRCVTNVDGDGETRHFA